MILLNVNFLISNNTSTKNPCICLQNIFVYVDHRFLSKDPLKFWEMWWNSDGAKLFHHAFVRTLKEKSEASHWRKCPQSQMKNTGRSSSEVLKTCGDQEPEIWAGGRRSARQSVPLFIQPCFLLLPATPCTDPGKCFHHLPSVLPLSLFHTMSRLSPINSTVQVWWPEPNSSAFLMCANIASLWHPF